MAPGDPGGTAARALRPGAPPRLRLPAVALRGRGRWPRTSPPRHCWPRWTPSAATTGPRSRCRGWSGWPATSSSTTGDAKPARSEARAPWDDRERRSRAAHDDDWDVRLDALRARHTLALLSPLHRAVLTLRYLDDLSVPDVAELVDRSVHATEGLLVRARAAFRRAYGARGGERCLTPSRPCAPHCTRSSPIPISPPALRARVERALSLPKGVIVSETTFQSEPRATAQRAATRLCGCGGDAVPHRGRHPACHRLVRRGARCPAPRRADRHGRRARRPRRARARLERALPGRRVPREPRGGAPRRSRRHGEPGGRDARRRRGRAPCSEAGATVERAPADNPYGRNAVVRDPFGHRWIISADRAELMQPGDIGYVSLWVPDVDRARDFFGSVLGWSFAPGSGPQGRQVADVTLHHGLWGAPERSTLFLCYLVDDVDAAVDAGARGGWRGPRSPPRRPIGQRGRLHSTTRARPSPSSARRWASPDRAWHRTGRARVISPTSRSRWPTRPGRAPSTVRCSGGTSPRAGWTTGGRSTTCDPALACTVARTRATGVPMYLVDDIGSAVERVAGRRRHRLGPRAPALRRDGGLRRRPGHPFLPRGTVTQGGPRRRPVPAPTSQGLGPGPDTKIVGSSVPGGSGEASSAGSPGARGPGRSGEGRGPAGLGGLEEEGLDGLGRDGSREEKPCPRSQCSWWSLWSWSLSSIPSARVSRPRVRPSSTRVWMRAPRLGRVGHGRR